MDKPDALRLADQLEKVWFQHEAAAELRRLHAENEALQNTKHYEAPPGFVLNPDYLVPELRAQRDALLEALKPMIDLAEFWINHRQERRVSEEQYNVWIALGHESTAMLKARAAIKAVEENT